MLLKEKVFLSNCDSVRALPSEELQKRFLLGLTLASGVVVSPNTILDNRDIGDILLKQNVRKYLNEEGAGRLVLRGYNLEPGLTLGDYFEALPGGYIVSSLHGAPRKDQLTQVQAQELIARLRATQAALMELKPTYERVALSPTSLQSAVTERLDDEDVLNHFFKSDGERQLFMLKANDVVSRSEWYQFTSAYFDDNVRFPPDTAARFRMEVIDPAYHSLFVTSGEGFLQDRIRHLTQIPSGFLDAGLSVKSLQRELSLLAIPYKLFQFVSAWGAGELLRFFIESGVELAETQATSRGYDFATRKNWFGLYPKMRNYIGLEVKK
ncbi:hypothetical protein [Aliidiomarina sanyensis]|uniref:Uncharacterized protein n=1 Tax=Aliidiomarina sanyensis TaxID=1249555 RepID=A0A432WNP1_9GAMM|nr:hypothetical protein [Aliidiomarina sanyensis]RUO35416.1 hypothetical protein CWE11_05240 [Aliidiomarina sanyensis]